MKAEATRFPIQIFNSLGREKQTFRPINPPFVGMYVCGPTVYGDPHLGHARAAVSFDLVFRYLRYLGYKVRYVRNITDVGHLEDDVAGAGEDKIAKKARLEKLEPMEVVQTYTRSYHLAMEQLNCLPPSIEPTATAHITEQIAFVEDILANGLAYEVDGSVYFDMAAYAKTEDYGKLSGKVLEDLMSGSRENLEGQEGKRSSQDFALWKKAKPEHIMKWPSPWGLGFPGWHIECTAMSTKYLGTPFDIHGGGLDLQFPHHEAEIAQCKAAHRQAPCNYWMHNNLLTINGQKMGKSLGNFINLAELFSGEHKLLEQAYDPMTVRFFMLQAHYGSPLDFSNEALQAAEKAYHRLSKALEKLPELHSEAEAATHQELEDNINALIDGLYREMSDDFNSAKVLANMFDLVPIINSFLTGQESVQAISAPTLERLKRELPAFFFEVLGMQSAVPESGGELETAVQLLIELRQEARANNDFATSDAIRDRLAEAGILLKDSKEGTTWELA